ncbi:hypothetical protein ABT147_31440 [Streptomyces sp. NPDC001868]|uniref:hypothetical protein n=1 Tax=Streptomyces sp. NPDC001868 TaxID=3154401 RepID=UPI003316C1FF
MTDQETAAEHAEQPDETEGAGETAARRAALGRGRRRDRGGVRGLALSGRVRLIRLLWPLRLLCLIRLLVWLVWLVWLTVRARWLSVRA